MRKAENPAPGLIKAHPAFAAHSRLFTPDHGS
jgi:hypothetical protein